MGFHRVKPRLEETRGKEARGPWCPHPDLQIQTPARNSRSGFRVLIAKFLGWGGKGSLYNILEQNCSVYPGKSWLSPRTMNNKTEAIQQIPESDFEWKTAEFYQISVQRWSLSPRSFSIFARKVLPVIKLLNISGWCSLFTANVNNRKKSPCWATKVFPLREHALL